MKTVTVLLCAAGILACRPPAVGATVHVGIEPEDGRTFTTAPEMRVVLQAYEEAALLDGANLLGAIALRDLSSAVDVAVDFDTSEYALDASGRFPFVVLKPTAPLADGWYAIRVDETIRGEVFATPGLVTFPGAIGIRFGVGAPAELVAIKGCVNSDSLDYVALEFSEPVVAAEGQSAASLVTLRRGDETVAVSEVREEGRFWYFFLEPLPVGLTVALSRDGIVTRNGTPIAGAQSGSPASFAISSWSDLPVRSGCPSVMVFDLGLQ